MSYSESNSGTTLLQFPAGQKRRSVSVRELPVVKFAIAQRRWLLATLALVSIWTAELFWVQSVTLVATNSGGTKFEMVAPWIRLGIDFAFIGALCLIFRGKWLIPVLLIACGAYIGLLTYFNHFGRPISLLTMFNQFSEGVQVADAAVEVIPRGAAMALVGVLVLKLGLLWLAGPAPLSRRALYTTAGMTLGGYAVLMVATTFVDPLHYVTTTRGVGRLGMIRGYLGPWFAEWYYLNDKELVRRAIERRQVAHHGLTSIEADIPIHSRLVIVQAESLDTNALGLVVDGVEVTPFLNGLRQRSMYYRVEANHDFGSSDADFALLNGCLGSPDCNTWLLSGYPFAETTPQLLAQCGYRTTVFHGNTGEFYGRRAPYERLGFDRILFKEELLRDFSLPTNVLGVKDQAVFDLSSRMLADCAGPECHFVITLTTHTPYKALEPAEEELFPNPQNSTQRYFNNLRYIDNCLRRYVESLGAHTTLLLYADHPTEGQLDEFRPDRDPATGDEFVPALIYDTDRDLSQLQRTRTQACATDGSLHLLDVVSYFREQVARNAASGVSPGESTAQAR